MKKLATFFLFFLSWALAGCEDAETVTLRVTMEVEANGTPHTSSSVINMRYSTGYTFLKSAGYTTAIYFGRHAPYVRIGEAGVLFLPLYGGRSPQVGLSAIIPAAFKLTSNNTSMVEYLGPISRSSGVVTYPLDHRMTPQISFIYLPNRMEPTSARRKTMKELASDYGITIKSIRLQRVSEPMTNTIKTVLPWIDLANRNQPLYKLPVAGTDYGHDLVNVYTYNLVGKL